MVFYLMAESDMLMVADDFNNLFGFFLIFLLRGEA
jgi:hypothetical protein